MLPNLDDTSQTVPGYMVRARTLFGPSAAGQPRCTKGHT